MNFKFKVLKRYGPQKLFVKLKVCAHNWKWDPIREIIIQPLKIRNQLYITEETIKINVINHNAIYMHGQKNT